MTYYDRFIYWLSIMEPLFSQIYGLDWSSSAYCFNLAGCREDGTGLFPRPASNRKLYRKDSKGELIRVGHTAELWLSPARCLEAIAKEKKPFHVLMWSPQILVIDCDSSKDTELFADLCKDLNVNYAFEPSNCGGHFFFIRNPRRWPSIFTGATINYKGETIVVDSCFGANWESGDEFLFNECGAQVHVNGRYLPGGRVLKLAICKECWDPSKLFCSAPVEALDSRMIEWLENPYKRCRTLPISPKTQVDSDISVNLEVGNRNVGLCRILGGFVKRNPTASKGDRLAFLEQVNIKLSKPLPDNEINSIVRSSFNWR